MMARTYRYVQGLPIVAVEHLLVVASHLSGQRVAQQSYRCDFTGRIYKADDHL
jgi:hypothetical protein